MADLNPQPIPPGRAVNVTVPAEVAFDLEKTQAVLAAVMDRVGCPTCTSGIDIRFKLEENFVVDRETGSVRPI
jgi:hypothetical protein